MPKKGPKKTVITSTQEADGSWTHEGTSGNDRFSVSTTQSTAVNVVNGNAGNDRLTGGSLGDMINGGAGNDHIWGGTGIDRITGGLGNDFLAGGADGDTFVFEAGGGKDTILDFDAGGLGGTPADRIELFGFAGLTAADLTITYAGTNAIIDTGDGRIHLKNFTGTLDPSDFTFL